MAFLRPTSPVTPLRPSLVAPPARAARRGTFALGAALALGAGGLGCDGTPRAMDASAAPSARMSAVAVRLDATNDKQPMLSALAFRAAFSGVTATDVLGLVDPLSTASPARDCQLRDLDSGPAALAAHGDGIELEELAGVGVQLAEMPAAIHPSPRLYPDVAPAIGGVVSEAGPLALGAWPAQLRITTGATPETEPVDALITVPTPTRVTSVNGIVPSTGASVAVGPTDLNIGLGAGAGESAVELRPFGATVALVCKVPFDVTGASPASFVVPHQLIAALIAASGAAPGGGVAASLDLVRRQSGESALASTRIAVEVRASSLVELRP